MSKSDNTYQNTKVQIPQGADRISFDSDAFLDFYSDTITGEQARTFLYTNQLYQVIAASGGAISVTNLPSGGNPRSLRAPIAQNLLPEELERARLVPSFSAPPNYPLAPATRSARRALGP